MLINAAASKPQIKPYNPNHREQLLSVWERSVIASHSFLSQKDFSIIKANLAAYDFSLTNLHCLMENDRLLGFVGLTNTKIDMLFLDPDYIGKGFGKLLIEFAMEVYHANQVDVNEQNPKALEFYQKFGFEIYERNERDDFGMRYPLLRMRTTK